MFSEISANKRNTMSLKPLQYDDDALELVTLPAEADPDPMNDFFMELGEHGEASINVYKMPGPGRTGLTFCFACAATDYTPAELMMKVQEERGAGEYQITATQKGRRGVLRKSKFRVDEPSPDQKARNAVEPARPDGTLQIMEFVERSLNRQSEIIAGALASISQRLEQPRIDPMEQQRQTLEMIASMREIFAPPAPVAPANNGGLTSAVSQLKEVLELKALLQSDKEPGEASTVETMMGMAKDFLPALVAAGQASIQQPAAQPQPRRAIARPPAQQPAPTTVPEPKPQENAAMLELMKQLNVLVDAAKRDADVELYAALVYDQFEVDQLEKFLTDPTALDKLATWDANVKAHRQWFDNLRSTILGWLAEDAANTDDNPTTLDLGAPGHILGVDGDAGDASGDVAAGTIE
jgi:hypothetical protein